MGQWISFYQEYRKLNQIKSARDTCKSLHRCEPAAPHFHILARITTLPAEVLLPVKANLSPSSLLSLSYTSKKFYLSSTVVVEDIFPKQHTAEYNGMKEREERLSFLCMLERDQRLSKSKLVCSSCIKVRATSFFTIWAVRDRPSERRCRGHEGRIWICTHKVWDYAQVHAFRDDPDRYQPAVAGARNFSWPYGPCECKNHSICLGITKLITSRPLLAVDMGSTISKFTFANALRPLNLDVCPHIKMNGPVVLKSLPEDYPMSAVDLDRKDSCLLRECAVCQTEFGYNFGLPSNGRIILRFVVMRNLDDFEGVTDPAWIS